VDFGARIDRQDREESAFVMTALRHVSSGKQVYDSYGYKSNDRYLLNYGFSFLDNCRHDGSSPNEVAITLFPGPAIGPGDGLSARKHELWGGAAMRLSLTVPGLANVSANYPRVTQSHNGSTRKAGLSRVNGGIDVSHGSATKVTESEVGATRHFFPLLRFLVANEAELEQLEKSHFRGIRPHRLIVPKKLSASETHGFECCTSGGRIERDEFDDEADDDDISATGEVDDEDGSLEAEEEARFEAEAALRRFLAHLASIPLVTPSNEARAWAELGRICTEALEAYRTTLEEDETLLTNSAAAAQAGTENGNTEIGPEQTALPERTALPVLSNAWNARVQVMGEKEILSYWKNAAAQHAASWESTARSKW